MKFSPSLVFASAAILQMTTQTSAAPPGIERFLTVAGPANCGGNDLFTIGFSGTTGAPCTSLADGAATDFWLEWELFNCTVDLFAEAGCPDGSLVLNIPAPAVPGSLPPRCDAARLGASPGSPRQLLLARPTEQGFRRDAR